MYVGLAGRELFEPGEQILRVGLLSDGEVSQLVTVRKAIPHYGPEILFLSRFMLRRFDDEFLGELLARFRPQGGGPVSLGRTSL
jgi:hypothetical protein